MIRFSSGVSEKFKLWIEFFCQIWIFNCFSTKYRLLKVFFGKFWSCIVFSAKLWFSVVLFWCQLTIFIEIRFYWKIEMFNRIFLIGKVGFIYVHYEQLPERRQICELFGSIFRSGSIFFLSKMDFQLFFLPIFEFQLFYVPNIDFELLFFSWQIWVCSQLTIFSTKFKFSLFFSVN